MLNSPIAKPRSWWGWLLFVLATVLIVPHVIVSMFWAPHDKYDDSGYALSVLLSLAHGDKL